MGDCDVAAIFTPSQEVEPPVDDNEQKQEIHEQEHGKKKRKKKQKELENTEATNKNSENGTNEKNKRNKKGRNKNSGPDSENDKDNNNTEECVDDDQDNSSRSTEGELPERSEIKAKPINMNMFSAKSGSPNKDTNGAYFDNSSDEGKCRQEKDKTNKKNKSKKKSKSKKNESSSVETEVERVVIKQDSCESGEEQQSDEESCDDDPENTESNKAASSKERRPSKFKMNMKKAKSFFTRKLSKSKKDEVQEISIKPETEEVQHCWDVEPEVEEKKSKDKSKKNKKKSKGKKSESLESVEDASRQSSAVSRDIDDGIPVVADAHYDGTINTDSDCEIEQVQIS